MTTIEVYEDTTTHLFHYQVFASGTPNARNSPTVCGLDIADLRRAAFFPIGDPRGAVHYTQACDVCSRELRE